MAHQIDDRWLWLGVGVFAFLAVKGVQHALTDIVRLTEIDPYQYEPKRKEKDHPEDSTYSFHCDTRSPILNIISSSDRGRPPRPGRQSPPQHRQRGHLPRALPLRPPPARHANHHQRPGLRRPANLQTRPDRRPLPAEPRERALGRPRRPSALAAGLCDADALVGGSF